MIDPLILSTVSLALFVTLPSQVGANPKQAVISPRLTPAQERVLFRVCAKAAPDELERCKTRQLGRMGYGTPSRYTGKNAVEYYEGMEQGRNFLQKNLRAKNVAENAEYWSRNRRTYRESPTQDASFDYQLRPYVDDVRQQRLACMLGPVGRARTRCLDQLGNRLRELMESSKTGPR